MEPSRDVGTSFVGSVIRRHDMLPVDDRFVPNDMGGARAPRIITVVGRPVIDRYLHVHELPGPGDKVLVLGRSTHFGGVADNFAVQVARLGATSVVLGEAGTDPESEAAVAALRDESIDVGALARVPGRRPLVSDVVVARSGDRVIYVDLPTDLSSSCAAAAQQLSGRPVPADLVYVGAWQAAMVPVVQALNGSGVPWACTLEAAVPPFAVADLAAPALVFGDEAAFATHAPSATFIGEQTVVVTTSGAQGAHCTLGLSHRREAVDAVPAPVIDTTGAGDCFAATFAVAWLRGSSRRRALQVAAVAAARSVGELGSRTGPDAATLVELLARWDSRF